ncbi:hypothetical protein PG999_005702 [Apiospora kogelbergensis]|uniref:C2H2-type domain-containing protein n=2 Tax=Apiospora kogelbergensis TaxID=1337665 RepID=A0AAW0QVQ7_9PEZI
MHSGYASADHMVLDPSLKYAGLSSQEPSPWYPQSFSRVSLPPDGSQYFMNIVFDARQPDGVTTPIHSLPPPMFGRQGTPSDHASSVSSSALSPGSSDNAPSTPPDEAAYSFPTQCGTWKPQAQSQIVQLTGMSDGVKLGDVNSLEDDVLRGFHEEKTTTGLPIRTFTMSSMGSNYEMDPMSQPEPVNTMRQSSPTELAPDVKEEICIPTNTNYPLPEPEDNDTTSLDDIEQAPQPAQDDDKDRDYKPSGSQRRPSNAKRGRKRCSGVQPAQPSKKVKAEPRPLGNRNRPADKPLIPGSTSNHRCPECNDVAFKDETGLQNHIKKQHTRPFSCVFAFAGCNSTFAAKNEWKRHVASQHLLLFYWLCDQDSCTKLSNSSSNRSCPNSPNLPNGAIFNRKDLYTQHVRRMHVPLSVKKQLKQKATVPEWEERVQDLQKEAHKPRCSLPEYMTCPAPGCTTIFDGPGAWDERMEHVAKHLEKAANGLEERTVFGGHNDPTLTEWAARPDVAVIVATRTGGWILNNPLKPEKNVNKNNVRPIMDDEDEDAEGEVVDDF